MTKHCAHTLKVLFPALLLAIQAVGTASQAQPASVPPTRAAPAINPDLLARRWDARWIAAPGTDPFGFGVYHFRKTLDLAERPQRFVVHVTADNRYQLWVNGERVRVGAGPRRPQPLALRDGRSRAAPARRHERARGGRVELRRDGAGGAGHVADGVPAAGRHEGRAGRQHQRNMEGGAQRRLCADSVHLRPDARLLRRRAGRAGGRCEAPVGLGDRRLRRCGVGDGASRRCRTAAPAARRGPRRTRRTGGCSCRGRSR